jgi:hypothetical protein
VEVGEDVGGVEQVGAVAAGCLEGGSEAAFSYPSEDGGSADAEELGGLYRADQRGPGWSGSGHTHNVVRCTTLVKRLGWLSRPLLALVHNVVQYWLT